MENPLVRYLAQSIDRLSLSRKKMAFVSGPRQVGKTTLAKTLGTNRATLYRNWDETLFRRVWVKNPAQLVQEFKIHDTSSTHLLILDEIHKSKGWKQKLKGLYDEWGSEIQILVTGSARLNVFKKGGDSLMGRFLNFRLHPLSLGEAEQLKMRPPEDWKASLFKKPPSFSGQKIIEKLLFLSGFPEPFFSADKKIHRIWQQGRVEKIVREDLRDLSRIPELSQVEMLCSLLPTKIGSPLSIQSLREDLEVSFDTVKRWIKYLETLYYHFELRPWSKSLPRSLKKEPKIYLYDWTEVENEGPRFENMIASHLLKACHFWTDTGEGLFELHYLKNKEKLEIDFLITCEGRPWLCVEAKLSDGSIHPKLSKAFLSHLGVPLVQVLLENKSYYQREDSVVISASRFLNGLP